MALRPIWPYLVLAIIAIVVWNISPTLAIGILFVTVVIAVFCFGASLVASSSGWKSNLGVVLMLAAFAIAAVAYALWQGCC